MRTKIKQGDKVLIKAGVKSEGNLDYSVSFPEDVEGVVVRIKDGYAIVDVLFPKLRTYSLGNLEKIVD